MAFDHRPIYMQLAMNAGVWAGDVPPAQLIGPINIQKLETTPATQEDDDLVSNIVGSVGEVLDTTKKVKDPAKFSMTFNSMPKLLLDLVLGADDSALSQTGATITDEAVTTALNVWTRLGHCYLSASGFSLKTAADAAVDAAKYVVDAQIGMIMAVHADAVGSMKATYTTATVSGETYEGGKAKFSYLMLEGKAYDQRSQQWGRLTIAKISVSNNQAQDWAKGGWMSGQLDGKMITPIGYNAPYKFELLTAS